MGVKQQIFATRAACNRVDCRENASVGQRAVELELHIARAFELLENDLVHLRARLDKRGSQNGEAAAAFNIAGSAKESFRRVKRRGVNATRQDATARGRCQVVGTRETREAVEQNNDVLPHFHQALRTLDDELGNLDVVFGRHIERGRDNLASDGALHIGYFLGSLVNEQTHQVHARVVRRDSSGDIFEHRGFTGLRRRHDKAALTLADRRNQIDHAGGNRGMAMLHSERLIRENRREVGEFHTTALLFRSDAVNRDDRLERGVLLVFAGGARLALHHIALAQVVAANNRRANIHVVLAGQIPLRAQESVTVLHDVENAGDFDKALGAHACLEHLIDELGLLRASGDFDFEFSGLFAQLRYAKGGQVIDIGFRSILIAAIVAVATIVAIVAVVAVIATVARIAIVSLVFTVAIVALAAIISTVARIAFALVLAIIALRTLAAIALLIALGVAVGLRLALVGGSVALGSRFVIGRCIDLHRFTRTSGTTALGALLGTRFDGSIVLRSGVPTFIIAGFVVVRSLFFRSLDGSAKLR